MTSTTCPGAASGNTTCAARAYAALCKAESAGRPAQSSDWLADMERRPDMKLASGKRGPKPKET